MKHARTKLIQAIRSLVIAEIAAGKANDPALRNRVIELRRAADDGLDLALEVFENELSEQIIATSPPRRR